MEIWPIVPLKQRFSLSTYLSSTETKGRTQLPFVLRIPELKVLSSLG